MTSGVLEESSKWNFGVGLGPLLSASQVLMSSRSAAARSMPRMTMAAVLLGTVVDNWKGGQSWGLSESVPGKRGGIASPFAESGP